MGSHTPNIPDTDTLQVTLARRASTASTQTLQWAMMHMTIHHIISAAGNPITSSNVIHWDDFGTVFGHANLITPPCLLQGPLV